MAFQPLKDEALEPIQVQGGSREQCFSMIAANAVGAEPDLYPLD